jgi:hypothetical protein
VQIGGQVAQGRPLHQPMSSRVKPRPSPPSTRYVIFLSLAGAVIYGVIGAVTLRWYWGVFVALWGLVLGATFLMLRHSSRRHP